MDYTLEFTLERENKTTRRRAAIGGTGDLAVPPGNRLEALAGTRLGRHSIRINDQWRIVFRWTPHGPADVGIVDYH